MALLERAGDLVAASPDDPVRALGRPLRQCHMMCNAYAEDGLRVQDTDTPFDAIDREIDALHDELDTCRQAMLLSRAAIWVGGLALVLVVTVAGNYRTPIVVFGAIAAVLGGTVWYGANASSRADAESRLAEAEDRKARLFDEVAIRNGWKDLTSTVH